MMQKAKNANFYYKTERNTETLVNEFEGARVQQIMPIPDTMAVMTQEENKDGDPVMCDSGKTKWPYGLALVEHKDRLAVWPIDFGDGCIDADARVVNRHKCNQCGQEMEILLEPGMEDCDVKYECPGCCRLVSLSPDGTEKTTFRENPDYEKKLAEMKNFKIRSVFEDERTKNLERYYRNGELLDVMPIPEDMAVMVSTSDENGEHILVDSRDVNWPTGLAVIKLRNEVDITPIDLVEGALEVDAQLVARHKCCKCGQEMKIRLGIEEDCSFAKYECEKCGRLIELEPDGTEVDVNE